MRAVIPSGVWAQSAGAAPGGWIAGRLPAVLQGPGPQGLAWWQWLALPLLGLTALVLGRLFGALTRSVLKRAFRPTASTVDQRWLSNVSPALPALWATAVFRWACRGSSCPPAPRAPWRRC